MDKKPSFIGRLANAYTFCLDGKLVPPSPSQFGLCPVMTVLINPSDKGRWKVNIGNDWDSDVTEEQREKGHIGYLWGANVIVHEKVPVGKILVSPAEQVQEAFDKAVEVAYNEFVTDQTTAGVPA